MNVKLSRSEGSRAGAMLTDLYQITMAFGYWKSGRAEQEAVFHLAFRKNPFNGGFAIAAGLEQAIDFLRGFRFEDDDLEYLASLTGSDGKVLFEPAFLEYLRGLHLDCDVDAAPEGTVVFPNEPLLRIRGSILQCQLLETALLNIVNFQTLVATKAARVCLAAKGDPVIEFGLRRAQGPDGGVSGSRAAFAGGCSGTSNVLAGKLYGIPVRGTHAHSWVMSFENEIESFEEYAEAMPNNCVFLVDTYETIDGVRSAIEVAKKMRARGHEIVGIRLDSGDLAYLSIEARKLLDAAGFPKAIILASNDLDETIIASLKEQGAAIDVWGVGTKLVTAYDQPALGGVYKLGAMRGNDGKWVRKVKLSEQAVKISVPGFQQVRRFRKGNEFVGDMIFDEELGIGRETTITNPFDAARRKRIDADAEAEDLLVPIFRGGTCTYGVPSLTAVRERAQRQLALLHPGIKRFVNPHEYPVGLEQSLHKVRAQMISEARV